MAAGVTMGGCIERCVLGLGSGSCLEKVLERDLALFKGTKAKQTEDLASRITTNASDVGHTMYAVLNISIMVAKIVVISAILSGISAVVTPCMALVIAYLSEKLTNDI